MKSMRMDAKSLRHSAAMHHANKLNSKLVSLHRFLPNRVKTGKPHTQFYSTFTAKLVCLSMLGASVHAWCALSSFVRLRDESKAFQHRPETSHFCEQFACLAPQQHRVHPPALQVAHHVVWAICQHHQPAAPKVQALRSHVRGKQQVQPTLPEFRHRSSLDLWYCHAGKQETTISTKFIPKSCRQDSNKTFFNQQHEEGGEIQAWARCKAMRTLWDLCQ